MGGALRQAAAAARCDPMRMLGPDVVECVGVCSCVELCVVERVLRSDLRQVLPSPC